MFKLHVEWQKKEKSMRVLITDQDIRDKYYKEQKYVGEMLWKKGKKKYDSKVRMAVKKVRKEKDIAEMRWYKITDDELDEEEKNAEPIRENYVVYGSIYHPLDDDMKAYLDLEPKFCESADICEEDL